MREFTNIIYEQLPQSIQDDFNSLSTLLILQKVNQENTHLSSIDYGHVKKIKTLCFFEYDSKQIFAISNDFAYDVTQNGCIDEFGKTLFWIPAIHEGYAYKKYASEGVAGILTWTYSSKTNKWNLCWFPMKSIYVSTFNLSDEGIKQRTFGI